MFALLLSGSRVARIGRYHAIYSFFLVRAYLDTLLLVPLCHLKLTGEQTPLYRFAAAVQRAPQSDVPQAVAELLRSRRLSSDTDDTDVRPAGSQGTIGALGAATQRFYRLLGADLGFLNPQPVEEVPAPAPPPR